MWVRKNRFSAFEKMPEDDKPSLVNGFGISDCEPEDPHFVVTAKHGTGLVKY